MSAIPQVPPRPTRSHHQQAPPHDIPQIPQRPSRRTSDRSQSPNRENFPRSPFNEPPLSKTISNVSNSGGLSSLSRDTSSTNLPKKPSMTHIPSIGQEGNEYADIDYSKEEESDVQNPIPNEPQETRNVAGDLPLHAPKPSFSNTTAKSRVSAVTRTDSTQAAAAGIGKAPSPALSPDDSSPYDQAFRHKGGFRAPSAASTERPGSAALVDDEHGIPEIGQRVPMYPDAGDVQAPSPAPVQQHPVGIGFHNSGASKPSRHHRRSLSGKEALPPGSYGMHGHGVQSTDQFEKDWYAKHPDALEREEHGEYGPGIGGGRGEWAMSSDDLNKLVYGTAKTKVSNQGFPNEQFGYEASEEYTQRVISPQHTGLRYIQSNSSQPHVESPLRKSSFPVDPDAGVVLQKTRSMDRKGRGSELAVESETETEDEDVHLAPPEKRTSKYTGSGYDPPTEDLGPLAGNTEAEGGFIEETGYGVPILASDEVGKTPGAEYQQPAVSPAQERRGSGYYIAGAEGGGEYQSGGFRLPSRGGSAANSRPSSRPGSIHSVQGLSRFMTHDDDRENMHTPLEDVDEYEPLFPDEEGNLHRKPRTVAERLKLREQMKRFPSQDIWEDTPNSLQLQATVETPEASPTQTEAPKKIGSSAFETADQEAARKGEPSEEERARLLPAQERLAKSNFKPHLKDEIDRPHLSQRFPSRDIWEDSPDSAQLETVVGAKSPEEQASSPPDAGLEAGAVVQTTGQPNKGVLSGPQTRDLATAGAPSMDKPSIPPRPTKYKVAPAPAAGSVTESQAPPSVPTRPLKKQYKVPPADAQVPAAPSKLSQETMAASPPESQKVPDLPNRPKPQVPARPSKAMSQESSETAPLSKITSASSVESEGQHDREAPQKVKPAVPSRPVGGKIANLKAGFLGDLESRLKLGPQGPKPQEKKEERAEPEAEEEKVPLADARKGRAKGPAKRKPATTAAAASDAPATGASTKWQVEQPWTVWETDDNGFVALGTVRAVSLKDSSTSPAPAPASASQTIMSKPTDVDPATEPKSKATDEDMKKAKVAVEESIQATDPLAKPALESPPPAPATTSDVATPDVEKERNPLSKAASTTVSSNVPSATISPAPAAPAAAETETKTTQAEGEAQ